MSGSRPHLRILCASMYWLLDALPSSCMSQHVHMRVCCQVQQPKGEHVSRVDTHEFKPQALEVTTTSDDDK